MKFYARLLSWSKNTPQSNEHRAQQRQKFIKLKEMMMRNEKLQKTYKVFDWKGLRDFLIGLKKVFVYDWVTATSLLVTISRYASSLNPINHRWLILLPSYCSTSAQFPQRNESKVIFETRPVGRRSRRMIRDLLTDNQNHLSSSGAQPTERRQKL